MTNALDTYEPQWGGQIPNPPARASPDVCVQEAVPNCDTFDHGVANNYVTLLGIKTEQLRVFRSDP
jgi:hypothetical protein